VNYEKFPSFREYPFEVFKISPNMDGSKPTFTNKTDCMDLKLIPNGPLFFDEIPTEMKHAVLNYLCNCSAFVAAAVCQEWRDISDKRLAGSEVVIGEVWNRCEESVCSKPATEDMFKAAAIHKLGLALIISKPVTQIDKEILTEALMNISEFTIVNDYIGGNKWAPILSFGQFEHFLDRIYKEDKIMEEVKLIQLRESLDGLNQEKLTSFLVSRVKRLTLDTFVFDEDMFFRKLLQDSPTSKLTHLKLEDMNFWEYARQNPTQVADALCKVRNVELCERTLIVTLNDQIMERLIENMLQRPIVMETLIMSLGYFGDHTTRAESIREGYSIEYYPRIDPEDLKTLFTKMKALSLDGFFTKEQLKAVESLPWPYVNVNGQKIEGSEDIFYSLEKFFIPVDDVENLPVVEANEDRISKGELDCSQGFQEI